MKMSQIGHIKQTYGAVESRNVAAAGTSSLSALVYLEVDHGRGAFSRVCVCV